MNRFRTQQWFSSSCPEPADHSSYILPTRTLISDTSRTVCLVSETTVTLLSRERAGDRAAMPSVKNKHGQETPQEQVRIDDSAMPPRTSEFGGPTRTDSSLCKERHWPGQAGLSQLRRHLIRRPELLAMRFVLTQGSRCDVTLRN